MGRWRVINNQRELEDKAFDFIKGFFEANGYSPSMREIAAGLGYKGASKVPSLLKALVESGRLVRHAQVGSRYLSLPPAQTTLTATEPAVLGRVENLLLPGLGWVELQEKAGSDLSVVNAARTSYLGESKGEEKDKELLFFLFRHNHTVPFEHTYLRFRIYAPLMVFWHLLRYRIPSANMQSGRFGPYEENVVYIPAPDAWRLQAKKNRQASEGFLDGARGAKLSRDLQSYVELGFSLYKAAMENDGVAREQARLFLPSFGVMSLCTFSCNVHSLLHILQQRLQPDVQHETRVYAEALFTLFKPHFPQTCEAFETLSATPPAFLADAQRGTDR